MKVRNHRGQLAFYGSLFISLVVLGLGILAYEVCEYCLAQQELQTAVEASALTCETSLTSSGNASDSGSQNNAFAAGAHIFQLNSILGNSLGGAYLTSPTQPTPPLNPGDACIFFVLLDPNNQQPLVPGQSPAGAVVQATAMYAYQPTFGKCIGLSTQPIRLQASNLSGVSALDLVVAMDISGGMDDNTPVTLVHRYWDFDNNYPPHHIVYMIPDIHGDPNDPAQGYLGDLFCYQASNVNALWPQGLDNGVLPTLPNCKMFFSDLPGSPTLPLRCAGSSDCGNPPGNYVAAYAGANSPPSTSSQQGVALNNDINNIAACVTAVDNAAATTAGFGWGGPIPDTVGGFIPPDARNQPMINLTQAIGQGVTDGITGAQIIEAFNAGNAAAGGSGSMYIQMTNTSSASMECLVPAGPPFVANSVTGFPTSYVRYNMLFQSGSTASSTTEVLAPSGTQGPSASNTPTTLWGPAFASTYTDLVVNLDGNLCFNSYTTGNFLFPCVGALVEASRGTLDDPTLAAAAGLDLGALGGITPQPGYQLAYQNAALLQVQPLQDIVSTLPNFLSLASQAGDTQLGLTTFNDRAGTKPNQTYTDSNIAPIYPAGGTSKFPLPGIQLAPNNVAAITNVLPGLRVGGNRNVAKALKAGLAQLMKSGRNGSQKAIVLVVDGAPEENLNGDLDQTTAWADARSQAAAANAAGVAIFCVAVTSDATTASDEQTIYSDTNKDPSAGGLPGIAGHGGCFYQVQYSSASSAQTDLNKAFNNIVRHLVSLVAHG